MVLDPFSGYGLRPVTLADQTTLQSYFQSLAEPLSDYTFSQLYTWRNSLRTAWKQIDGHLCVFVNGTGDLTLLLPPIGEGNGDRALRGAYEIMDDYNDARGVRDHGRIEYVSEELLARFDRARLSVSPMGTDYLYDVTRMIELPGGDLASKRQAKNRFMRQHEYRVEAYEPARHLEACRSLLHEWKAHQDAQHNADPTLNGIKRQKESLACELCLESAAELGLKGMVVYVRDAGAGSSHPASPTADSSWSLRAFTFGEYLGARQSSITIEKTDLACKGLAQFIFSEFCRLHWADRPLVNVGDDWGLETLAWTKQSYRPVKLLQKYVMRLQQPLAVSLAPAAPVQTPVTSLLAERMTQALPLPRRTDNELSTLVRPATREDLPAIVELEQSCFSAFNLKRRQLQYLQKAPTAVFVVAEQAGAVVAEGIALVRHHQRKGRCSAPTGRVYSLAVKESCRGQRIGAQLLAAMIAGLLQRGVQRIYLEVEAANDSAQRLYVAHGFVAIGKLPHYYGPDRHGIHMMYDAARPAELFTAPARAIA
jgi:ribosomal protein S18 acetylase RimI-like enzyme